MHRFALSFVCCLLLATAVDATPPFLVFDNGVGRGSWTPAQQAQTLEELGDDGSSYNYTTPEDLERLTVRETTLPGNQDAKAVAILRQAADVAQASGVRIALYGHAGFSMEHAADAARLAAMVARPYVGATINLRHELMSGQGNRLDRTLAAVAPAATLASITGMDVAAKNLAANIAAWRTIVTKLDQASPSSTAPANTLSAEEKAAGWTLLFDGKTTTGWRGFKKPGFPAAGWVVEDGTLKSLGAKGGDIITTATYTDFEFSWEWKLSPQGNSGVKYFVSETRGNETGAIGHEYQTIDDDHYTAMPLNALQKTGAWYDVLPPTTAAAHPIGSFNHSRLIVQGDIVEHWLNGILVLRYDITSPEAAAGIAASKFKTVQGFADKIPTPILLQDHDTVVWFRNLKIRPVPAH